MHAAVRTGGENGLHLCSDTILLITEPYLPPANGLVLLVLYRVWFHIGSCTERILLRFHEIHPARPPPPLLSQAIWILPVLRAPSCFLSLLLPFAHSISLLSQQVEQLNSFDTDAMTYCRLEHKADSQSSFHFFLFPLQISPSTKLISLFMPSSMGMCQEASCFLPTLIGDKRCGD